MELKEMFGRNFNINQEISKRYHNLLSYFIFKGRDQKNIFMLCVALGFRKGVKRKVDKPEGLINTASMSNEDLWTIASIAIKDTQDITILSKPNEMKRIALEYSMTGLEELEQLSAEYGTGENLELAIEKMAMESIRKISRENLL